jgi:hypothetical protein
MTSKPSVSSLRIVMIAIALLIAPVALLYLSDLPTEIMKLIELNIGLTSKSLGKLNHVEVLNALTGRGFECLKYRLVESISNDGAETCLAWKGTPPADWQNQLASLSDKLGQDCIAITAFIGQSPYDAFVPSLWVEPEESNVSDADKFIGYLENTLIPDLIESGYEATAEDFKILIGYYKDK